MESNNPVLEENNSKILSVLMLIILFVSMGQSVYWQTMPIIGREFNFTEVEINTVVSISAAMLLRKRRDHLEWGSLERQIILELY